jgi:hypothetical protein
VLARWLQENPDHAKVTHADLEALGPVEKTLDVGANSVRSLGASLFSG